MDEYYEYHEYRPDHFVKLKHGEVISKISKVDMIWEELSLEGYTETRNIAVPFGLAVLTGIFIFLTDEPFTRLMLIAGYICFSALFFISLAAYTIPKMQLAGKEYIFRKNIDKPSDISYYRLITWLLIIWPIRILFGKKHSVYSEVENQTELLKEFGHILLFWVMVLFWGILLPLINYFLVS
jgi:hypothetical protein